MFQKIVVALDGSPSSENALTMAVEMTKRFQADLVALSVAQLPESAELIGEIEEIRNHAENRFAEIGEAAVESAAAQGVSLRSVVLHGHVADTIVRYVESEHAQLLIIGQHGHSRIRRFFLGSTADRVSEHCLCTVMIVK
jgi:nucleotide-binding universal stress UspA family protein